MLIKATRKALSRNVLNVLNIKIGLRVVLTTLRRHREHSPRYRFKLRFT